MGHRGAIKERSISFSWRSLRKTLEAGVFDDVIFANQGCMLSKENSEEENPSFGQDLKMHGEMVGTVRIPTKPKTAS